MDAYNNEHLFLQGAISKNWYVY